jgi:hypothetical protein
MVISVFALDFLKSHLAGFGFVIEFDHIPIFLQSPVVVLVRAVYLKLPAHQKIFPVGVPSTVPSE